MKGSEDKTAFRVRARSGELANPMEVVFPIFRTNEDGSLAVLATGFFITRYGWFVTAKHVVMDVIDANGSPEAGLCILQFTDAATYYVRPITGFSCHEVADVAIGVCAPMSHKMTGEPLYNKVARISRRALIRGESVWTYAYPGTKVKFNPGQHIDIVPNYFAGRVVEYFPNGRDRTMLPAPCHRTSIILHAASSGGPVFAYGGATVGINSTGLEGADDISFISRISDIFSLEVPDVVVPSEVTPRRVTIQELAEIRHVAIDT